MKDFLSSKQPVKSAHARSFWDQVNEGQWIHISSSRKYKQCSQQFLSSFGVSQPMNRHNIMGHETMGWNAMVAGAIDIWIYLVLWILVYIGYSPLDCVLVDLHPSCKER